MGIKTVAGMSCGAAIGGLVLVAQLGEDAIDGGVALILKYVLNFDYSACSESMCWTHAIIQFLSLLLFVGVVLWAIVFFLLWFDKRKLDNSPQGGLTVEILNLYSYPWSRKEDTFFVHGPPEPYNVHFSLSLSLKNPTNERNIVTNWRFFLLLRSGEEVALKAIKPNSKFAQATQRKVLKENFIWTKTENGIDPCTVIKGAAALEIPEIFRSSELFHELIGPEESVIGVRCLDKDGQEIKKGVRFCLQ